MKNFVFLRIALATVLVLAIASAATAADKPRIGVTLHPYYSWVAAIAGDAVEIVPVIPEGADPHSYQPRPSDLERLESLDAVVVNGLGHDGFIEPMLKAAGKTDIPRLNPHEGMPLAPIHGEEEAFAAGEEAVAVNPHTYISILGSVQQINTLARQLGALYPDHAEAFRANARRYARTLRAMLGDALAKIEALDASDTRIATVHDGYAYLFSELGLTIAAVIQPRHGIEPSARQLQDTIKQIEKQNVTILFGEADYKKKYVDIIYEETGCKIYRLSHISGGAYAKEKFETDMQTNLDTIVRALTDAGK